ncbi:MAG: peptidylprolyl isomerase [Candidatus Delongbacteria bacterium]|nr:peptidylprolyl isomerase [Candidatus Delongbacteria bacterium]
MSARIFGKLTLMIVVLSVLFSCKDQLKDITIGESSLGKISFSEFETSMLKERFGNDRSKASESSFEDRREYLKEIIYKDIIFDLAEKNQIDTIQEVRNEYRKKLYNISIIQGLIHDSLRSKIYTEADIKKAYEQKKMKYLPKHILIDSKKRGEAKAKEKIDSVYQRVISGEKFEDLAKSESDDIRTGVNGGELGWVFPYEMVKEFEEQVTGMKKGDISAPFKSLYGYHIIMLSDLKENSDLKDYDSERNRIIPELDKKYSAQFNDKYLKLIEGLLEKYEVRIDSAEAKKFIKRLNENRKNSEGENDYLDLFTDEEKSAVIAVFGDRIIDVAGVIAALRTFPKDSRPELKGYTDIKMYVIERFRNSLFEKYSDDLGYTKRKDYVEEAKSTMYGTYKDKLVRKFVRDRVELPTNEEIAKFYEENKENMFKVGDGSYKDLLKVKASITNSLKSKKFGQSLKDWESGLFKDYRVIINYPLIEKTFSNIKDDRK